ncbi:DUF2207 domain-containing protein [Homoserinimonas sp. OAct 916]|uniref:DUF2207 domain-containing protein n=1 Tax=Homoserinimonas sp. OAct 916 TaxID=2211450 RepID=UPI000DBE1BF9|nr:DUF2207 domain-containing protein [Homoserinimonas sp. OAct 916]
MSRRLLVMAVTAGLALGALAATTCWTAQPVAAASLESATVDTVAVGTGPVTTGVNDFEFDSFDGDYTLGRDSAGRSTLKTVETLVARFPDSDQNRGIRRELAERYDGHPIDLNVTSVTDERGQPRAFTESSDDGFRTLTIADSDYVHGTEIYVITYTSRNVTRYFADTNADEFYWDTNGTGWGQPFGKVSAEVHLSAALQAKLTGNANAASGLEGERGPATITETDDGFAVSATNLGPGENLTFAIGFDPGTFTPRDDSFLSAPWPILSLLGTLAALLVAGWALLIRRTHLRDAPSRGIIIAEYLPPKDASLLLSSVITRTTAKSTPAQVLALAVAGNLRIIESEASGFSRKPSYELEFVSADGADADATEFLHAVFGDTLTEGEHRNLKKRDQKAIKRLTELTKRVTADAVANGYRRRRPAGLLGLLVLASVLASISGVVFAIVSLSSVHGSPALLAVFLFISVLAFATSAVLISHNPLDTKGVKLRDYLLGLREYISLAEADRLRYLQSIKGAERTPVTTGDPRQVIKINERLLPYAVLFGIEKSWAEELGRNYEQVGERPSWFVGSGGFNAALFASSIGSMSVSASSAYSSTSGGSGGGAASGGGGGGGGGGGV